MAVDFIQPVTGGPFGPGFIVSLGSDFVGPLETGSFWRLYVHETGEGSPLISEDFPTASNNAIWWFRTTPSSLAAPFPFAGDELYHGKTVGLTAELRSPTTVEDSGTIPIVWDIVSGVPYVQNIVGADAAGLTVDQAAQLEAVEQAVHMSFPGLPNLPIGEFLGIPIAGGAERVLITPDRTGEGTLDRQVGLVDVAAVGIEWEVVSAPPGVGVAQGAPDRWVRRVLDLQLVGTDASANEYTRSYESFHVDHYRLMFQGFGLTRLHYWIEPGITIRFYWLVFGI